MSPSASLESPEVDVVDGEVPEGKQCKHDGCSWRPEEALNQNPMRHDWGELFFEHLNESHDGKFPFEV